MEKKRVGNFRSSILGGFNRRDVIGYIEKLHKNLSEVKAENELLRAKLSEAESGEKEDGADLGELQESSLDLGTDKGEMNPIPESADVGIIDGQEPELDGGAKAVPDSSEPVSDVKSEEEPNEPDIPAIPDQEESPRGDGALSDIKEGDRGEAELTEEIPPEQNTTPTAKILHSSNKKENKPGKHIDVPVSTIKAKGSGHTATKNNVKVRKKSKS